jgi:hypothetical protein
MMPALHSSTSIVCPSAWISSAQAATEPSSLRSQATGVMETPAPAAAAAAFSRVRARPMIWAPRPASTRIDSRPSPELQPVIRMRLPRRSSPSVTSCAVERRVKCDFGGDGFSVMKQRLSVGALAVQRLALRPGNLSF